MMFLRAGSLAFAAFLFSSTAAAQAGGSTGEALLQELDGSWRLSVSNPERRIDRAIARGTEDLGFPIRDIARGRLGDVVDAERRVVVRSTGSDVVVQLGSWGPFRLPLDGRFVPAGDGGQDMEARALIDNGCLVIQQRSDDGTRTVYLCPEGGRMTATMRIRSERLPDDIVYRLRYGPG